MLRYIANFRGILQVARGEEVQACIDRVQQFVVDIEDIGIAVSQHNDAIERAATGLAEQGSEFETHVEALRQDAADLNKQLENIMSNMNAEVAKVVQEMEQSFVDKALAKANESATKIAKKLISELDTGAVSSGKGGDGQQSSKVKSQKGKGQNQQKRASVSETKSHSSEKDKDSESGGDTEADDPFSVDGLSSFRSEEDLSRRASTASFGVR